MTSKLQLLLINVLIRSILDTNVLQGSVATALMCNGIYIMIISLASLLQSETPRVKSLWKSINTWRSYGQLSTGSFLWNTVYHNVTDGRLLKTESRSACPAFTWYCSDQDRI